MSYGMKSLVRRNRLAINRQIALDIQKAIRKEKQAPAVPKDKP